MMIQNTDTALEIFEEAATSHSNAIETGDYKVANKSYDRIIVAAAFLKQEGKIRLVSKFLNHASSGVRSWAAAYLLPIQEQDAIRVLESVAKGKGLLSFEAEMTLSEWRKGNLKL